MGKKSYIDVPDDDAWRRLRNWVAAHPEAGVGELHDVLAALGRPPSWRELAAALELFGKQAPGGAPPPSSLTSSGSWLPRERQNAFSTPSRSRRR